MYNTSPQQERRCHQHSCIADSNDYQQELVLFLGVPPTEQFTPHSSQFFLLLFYSGTLNYQQSHLLKHSLSMEPGKQYQKESSDLVITITHTT